MLATRLTILKLTLATLLLAIINSAYAKPLPNMLVFIADDLGYMDTKPYGSPDSPTPNVAKLAKEGMRFDNAFVNSPSCAPSRAALFTSLRSQRNGVEANHDFSRLPGVITNLGALKSLGYEIASFGKVQHGNGNRETWDHGFTHLGSSKIDPKEIESFLKKRDKKKPLLLFVGSRPPHVPWPHTSSFSPNKVTLPPKSVDTQQTRINWTQYLEDVATMDTSLGKIRKLFKKYVSGKNNVTMFTSDHGAQWPFAKWNLYDAGVKVPLIVSWPGKIKKNSASDALVSWIDIIPTLTDIAGENIKHDIDGKSFKQVLQGDADDHRNQVFLTHTGDGAANVYPQRAVRTKKWKYILNLHPEFLHRTHQQRNVWMEHNKLWPTWVEKAKTDKSAREQVARLYSRPPEELFDIENDPHEEHNLAGDPRYRKVLEQLRNDVNNMMIASRDQRPLSGPPIKLVDCYLGSKCEVSVFTPPPSKKKNKH